MEGGYSRINEEIHHQLLDLISRERNWFVKKDDQDINGSRKSHENGDEKKLELRLGPPGVEDYKSPTKTPQKRSAPAPVVGWPPIRSFRKNIASNSSKQNVFVPNDVVQKKKNVEICQTGLFVKINMHGVAIGRKVDLNAYDSYEKLSIAVDQLFRGLLAAQKETIGDQKHEKAITGLLDGNGEYTLVYEDNEGDRMLVGDVPWHMFVSTVKRLRVIKSSEISDIRLGSKQEKIRL